MKKFSALVILVAACFSAGCGSSALGPAKPADTPVVKQEEIQEHMTKGMPPEMMKKYQKYGGGPSGS